jgi:hypothetical protein
MPTIEIELSDAEYAAMEYVSYSPEEWAENAVKVRANIAKKELVNVVVKHCFASGDTVPATEDETVLFAFSGNVVKTAKQLTDEQEAADLAALEESSE